jgi:hypothetical protein
MNYLEEAKNAVCASDGMLSNGISDYELQRAAILAAIAQAEAATRQADAIDKFLPRLNAISIDLERIANVITERDYSASDDVIEAGVEAVKGIARTLVLMDR